MKMDSGDKRERKLIRAKKTKGGRKDTPFPARDARARRARLRKREHK